MMALQIVSILIGLPLLAWSADRFIAGAAALARHIGVSPLVAGVAVVGLGTSAPEMFVSALAALQGNPGLGIGNAVGSNITNIALVLGISAMVTPLTIRSVLLRRELPLLFAIMLFALALMWDLRFTRLEGTMLVAALIALVYWLIRLARQGERDHDPMLAEMEAELPPPMPPGPASLNTLIGLIVLLLSSRLLVWAAAGLASAAGISDMVIGLSIVAVGTSLPELAASVTSALKGEHDIAVGNVVGSNMFNLLGVLAMPGLLHPGPVEFELLARDFPVMMGLTVLLYLICRTGRGANRMSRLEGGLFAGLFIMYQSYLFLA